MLRKNSDHVYTDLPDYLLGKSTPQVAERIEQHIRKCDECNEIYRSQRALFEKMSLIKKETVSPSIWGPFLVNLNERIDSRNGIPYTLWEKLTIRIPVFTALSLAVFGLIYFSTTVMHPPMNSYTQELRNLISQFDTTEIHSLKNQFLWSNAFSFTSDVELSSDKDIEEIDEVFPQTVFEGLSYDQLLAGSSEYLSHQDILELYSDERLLDPVMNGNSSM